MISNKNSSIISVKIIGKKNKIKSLSNYLAKNDIKSPKTGNLIKITDDTFLADAIALITIPIVIIIDGLDKVGQVQLIKFHEFLLGRSSSRTKIQWRISILFSSGII
jgi:hypothetical protein